VSAAPGNAEPERAVPSLRLRLTRPHLGVFLGLLAVFSLLTAMAVAEGADDGHRVARVAGTTAGTILGPFTGALARDWQSCCTRFSLFLLPWAGGALALGVALQVARRPAWWRLVAWGLGWTVWLGAGLLSFAHAFS
jgi:hypothetical protein